MPALNPGKRGFLAESLGMEQDALSGCLEASSPGLLGAEELEAL